MNTISINNQAHSVTNELYNQIKNNSECRQTVKFLVQLGIMTGEVKLKNS